MSGGGFHKDQTAWHSQRLEREARLVRWGHFGTPVLMFPTAGGDAEECERMLMVEALGGLIAGGRIKLYSLDSVAGRAWLERQDPHYCSVLQNRFDSFVYHEVVPAIRADCGGEMVEVVTAGASIGAFNAVASLCRHPDVFRLAIGMSGTYDLEGWLHGRWNEEFYFASPMHFVPNLDEGEELARLRERFVLLATGEGEWEDPEESWRMAEVLGRKGIPNRVDAWGVRYPHDWTTWREMLPRYLEEMA